MTVLAEPTPLQSTLGHAAGSLAIAEPQTTAFAWMPPIAQHLPTWQPTFMHGFIFGQISMLVLLVMAIKYVLFEEPLGRRSANDDEASAMTEDASSAKKGTVVHEGGFGLSKFTIFSRKPKEPQPSDLTEELARMHKEILARTDYSLHAHGPESCNWLTVFLAQIIAKFRADAERHDRLVRVISEALNGELRPSAIDSIRITQFSLGSDFLRIVSARMAPATGSLGMRAELDLALHDDITLGFNTRVLVNWPRTAVAALPVSMVISLVKFAGTVAIEFDCESAEPSLSVSILPDYVLEFDVQTLIGSKAKVQNLPMLTSVISRKLQSAFAKELVMPNEKRIPIKHPFTAKPTATAGPGQSDHSPETAAAADKTQSQQSNAANASLAPFLESKRPVSPLTGPPVADLPPDYNTQLPPPHPLRSTANSRATAANASTSPLLGQPPRMYTPDEPTTPPGRPTSNSNSKQPSQQQPLQRSWSPETQHRLASPRLQPVIGLSSAAAFGPVIGSARLPSVGPRFAGSRSAFSQSPLLSAAAGDQPSPSSANQEYLDDDDLRLKDSVRQRVNRVIKSVNEA
ncbi:ERMES complex subunit mmm1 [Coemansia guatemalensis]|uniref:Maintenance of mitochondrial morphology protein 1 n=1 Tax=Coemansia guatemalensis TaxID=2761395 RepID=A0A9W8HZN8_9FUNG|nr:ERMES complex subunit mmm1 [Coemansia guatemalensis]